MAHIYGIIIYFGVGTPGNGRDIFDGLNVTDKRFISISMENTQFNCSKGYNNQMEMYTTVQKEYVIQENKVSKHLYSRAQKR